jgi:membrane protease YdiL (CAAX protease family)
MKQQQIRNTIIVILAFLVANFGMKACALFYTISISEPIYKIIIFYAWWLLPSLFAVAWLFGFNNIIDVIGIKNGFFKGLAFALITVLPMFLSSAIVGQIDPAINWLALLHKTILAGLMEEYLFRGFLFGLLFLKCGWGFIPSSLLGAVIFGMGHVYQGHNFAESFGVFMITGMGALWFAWLYVEWNNNLWVPICLHVLMNISWSLFDVSATALGGPMVNLFRTITIVLTVIITIKNSKKHGFKVNMHNLFYHKNSI